MIKRIKEDSKLHALQADLDAVNRARRPLAR